MQAQKLLFGHSEAGDLTPLFSGYFDTGIGGKKEAASYQAIADRLGLEPDTILFLSDVDAELSAAEAAGLRTCWLVREGELPQARRPVVRDFAGVERVLAG